MKFRLTLEEKNYFYYIVPKPKKNINNPAIKVINAYIQEAEKENIKTNFYLKHQYLQQKRWQYTKL